MTFLKPTLLAFALLHSVAFVAPQPAHAYIDPGTGSYIFQMLIAGLIGGLFAMKQFWRRGMSFFKRLFGEKGNGDSQT
jgi:drug/metabolite transporter (DMT)-like permease